MDCWRWKIISIDFRKAFFPTDEELKGYEELIISIEFEKIDYFKSIGFTNDEYLLIKEIENYEFLNTHKLQEYSSMYSLHKNKIITTEQIKEKLKSR